ncbi:unnamed protein product [Schistosoma margrebowiei]|uniref:Uncharacterized protein n=1 Tax=Schistosoma margrebowiei TaxID=48269 RepID=A0A183NBB9_9TREM|nr:unnamed protein product [Schistosoma margrebowiei]
MFTSDVAEPYEILKRSILNRGDLTDRQRLDQLFNNIDLQHGSATDMLQRMREVIGIRTFDEDLFKQLFLSKLPQQVQAVLVSFQNNALDELAASADRILEITKSSTTELFENCGFSLMVLWSMVNRYWDTSRWFPRSDPHYMVIAMMNLWLKEHWITIETALHGFNTVFLRHTDKLNEFNRTFNNSFQSLQDRLKLKETTMYHNWIGIKNSKYKVSRSSGPPHASSQGMDLYGNYGQDSGKKEKEDSN